MRHSLKPICFAALATFGSHAQAHAQAVPIHCDYPEGTDETGCSIAPLDLASPQDDAMDFKISYHFNCSGNHVDVGVQTDQQYKSLVTGSSSATLTVTGQSFARVMTPNAAAFYAADLASSCTLSIDQVETTPAPTTVKQWRQQAIDTAKILDLSLTVVERDQGLIKVISWDDDQLQATEASLKTQLSEALPSDLTYDQLVYPANCGTPDKCGKLKDEADMPSGWDMAVALNPQLSDLVALRSQVASIIAGRPPVYSASDLTSDRADLSASVTTANNLLSRANKYLLTLDADTQAAMSRLQQLHDKAAGLLPAS